MGFAADGIFRSAARSAKSPTALVVGLGAARGATVLFTSGVARRVERLTARATPGGDLASPRRGDELAAVAGADPASFTRLAKALGYSGWDELRSALTDARPRRSS